MNLMTLTNNELIHYLNKHSSDPVMIKLTDFFLAKEEGLVVELERIGMDSDGCFQSEHGEFMTPGDYIRHLQNELEYQANDAEESRIMYQQANRQIEELKSRSIAKLIAELNDEIHTQSLVAAKALEQRDKAYADRSNMKSQLSMWAKLNGQV